MTQVERVLSLIEEALDGLRPELVVACAGGPAVDSTRSLEFMKDRLETMKSNLMSGTKEGPRYKGSMTHIINDTWPIENALGELISEVEHQYYRLA